MKVDKKKPVIFLICSGLGNVNRGYESFTQECFEALKNNNEFNLYLIKGGGKKDNHEIVLPNFRRNGTGAKFLSKILKKNTYTVEQISFCIALFPLIIKKKPALIYYSDFLTGTYLWHLRKFFQFKYKLLFCNGAPNGPPFKTEDHIQQLLPVYYSIGIKSEGSSLKHTLLPYAFNINVNERTKALYSKEKLRLELGFLPHQKIILSVGAVNARHKRIDYIINELSLLDDKFFLVVLGQFDETSIEIKNLAESKLCGRYIIKNIPYHEVQNYYIAADYFVLASLSEGFGRVAIEALSFGLPCIVHNYVITKQVLGDNGIYIDMRFDGELSAYLSKRENNEPDKQALINAAYNLYSWDRLKDDYALMLLNLINKN